VSNISPEMKNTDLNFIVIEGNIGAGKTSLSTKIAEEYNAKLILEQFDENPFLPKFYQDRERYSFQLELSFLADRFHQLHKELTAQSLFKTFTVADYYFTKSLIFSGTTLSDEEYKLYRRLFKIIYTTLPKPNLYVYLHVAVDNLLKNIRRRGREYERQIKPDYLENIQQAYFDYFKQNSNDMSFLVIDTNKIDFIKNVADYKRLKEIIFGSDYPTGITRVIM